MKTIIKPVPKIIKSEDKRVSDKDIKNEVLYCKAHSFPFKKSEGGCRQCQKLDDTFCKECSAPLHKAPGLGYKVCAKGCHNVR